MILKKIKENLAPLSLILTVPLFNLGYQLTNNPNRPAYILGTSFDNSIPFLKLFIVPYMLWYTFLILGLAYLCLNCKETFYKTILSIDIGLLICFFIYIVFQTEVPRPVVEGNDFLSMAVRYMYQADPPLNCLPSIHALTSFLVIRAMFTSSLAKQLAGKIIVPSGILIIISTLFVKQHIVLDLLVALVLGDLIYRLVSFLLSKKYVYENSLLTVKKRSVKSSVKNSVKSPVRM